MSEANIGLTLASNSLKDTSYVDSSVSQTSITSISEADSSSHPETGIPQTTAPLTWSAGLRQLGREFAEIRQAQGMSVYQLHAQTLVPLHILTALESGDLTRLPEKIYVQGMIRRMGDALGLDGAKLAASLPIEDSMNSFPEARRVSKFNLFYLTRFHLYLGYIALLVAAISALSGLDHKTPQDASADRVTDPVMETETSSP